MSYSVTLEKFSSSTPYNRVEGYKVWVELGGARWCAGWIYGSGSSWKGGPWDGLGGRTTVYGSGRDDLAQKIAEDYMGKKMVEVVSFLARSDE